MTLLSDALKLTADAYTGLYDAAGAPLRGHINRVTANAEKYRAMYAPKLEADLVAAVAVLHDAVEDTHLELEDISDKEVREAVAALTHHKGEKRDDYIARILTNPVALVVKLGDNEDNGNEGRLAKIEDTARRDRLRSKYARERAMLLAEAIML